MRLLIVPAAGRGSRLGAAVPKPFVTVAGISMLDRLVDLYDRHVERFLVVVNPSFVEDAREFLRCPSAGESTRMQCRDGLARTSLRLADDVLARHQDWN